MWLSDGIVDKVPPRKEEGPPTITEELRQEARVQVSLMLLDQYHMIHEVTLTKDRVDVSKDGTLTDVTLRRKPRGPHKPGITLVIIGEAQHRGVGHRRLEVTAQNLGVPRSYLTKSGRNDWLLVNALCVGKQGTTAVIAPPSGP
jgi:hypothetical protein